MIPAKHFYMIRHGETEANAAQIMAGSLDSSLTEKGRRQAEQARELIVRLDIKPARIHHSHLSRARETATIINQVLDVDIVEDPDLAEIYAGELEGVPWEECHDIFEGWKQAPGGEHPDTFFQRIRRGKHRALSNGPGPALIVCHGGVMRGFGKLHGMETPASFKNAHLYEFCPAKETSHFPWTVYDYELCSLRKIVKRNLSKIYHPEEEDQDSAF